MRIPEQAYQFQTHGEPFFCAPYGNGHINQTFLLVDSTASQYILQKINRHVFREPEALMRNIAAVTQYLRKTAASPRETLYLIPTKNDEQWHVDSDGEIWRLYRFISDCLCLEKAETTADFLESGAAFGRFQQQLNDFPAHTLTETIPKFHDTPNRYATLHKAIQTDSYDRTKEVQREITFALERESYADTLVSLQNKGDLPLRVTHNDTKLNNVLFDRDTRKALCVIDLDTVMPGLSVNDFGDSIRFGASTAAEDERDLEKVQFSLPLFEAYTDGFLSSCGQTLTPNEKGHLRDGAKMMTLECGVRFLTDYLSGDTYFRVHRPGHNLDRCRTQFKLVSEMEQKWDEMGNIVERFHR